jgi:hypothetical protein
MAAVALLNMRMTDDQRIRLLLDDRVECFRQIRGLSRLRLDEQYLATPLAGRGTESL